MLIDSHAHLDDDSFDNDREDVIARAFASDIGAIISIGSNIPSSQKTIELAERHKNVYASVGLHPHEAKKWGDGFYTELKDLAREKKVVAVGETGLDYHYDNSPREIQGEVFRQEIRLALEVGRPLVIHSREADEDTAKILSEERAEEVGGVMHCYSSGRELALKSMDMGFYISLSGIVTFPKAVELQELVVELPLDRILLETDSPYLSPIPYRGKRNEPANVGHTAQKVAQLKGLTLDEIVEVTRQNTKRLFGISV